MPEVAAPASKPKRKRAKADKPPNGAHLEPGLEAEPLAGEVAPIQTLEDLAMMAQDKTLSFFDLVKMIPDPMWNADLMIYLYRLEPTISNKPGDKKYIEKYAAPIDEDAIKRTEGGGKFKVYLKSGTDTVREETFSIEGSPKLREGQTMRDGTQVIPPPGQPAPAPPQQSKDELVSLLTKLVEAMQGKGGDEAMNVMADASKRSLELMQDSLKKQIQSPTGNALADRLMEAALTNMLAPKTAVDPITVVKEALGLVRQLDRRENPAAPVSAGEGGGILGQLTIVKELFGVDSVIDAIRMVKGGAAAAGPDWGMLLSRAVEALPLVMQNYAVIQEANFRRAVEAARIQAQLRGQPGPGAPPAPAPGPFTPGIPSMPFPPPGAATMPPTMPANPGMSAAEPAGVGPSPEFQVITQLIVRCWDENDDGGTAALVIKRVMPALTTMIAPLIGKPEELRAFVDSIVKSSPVLLDLSQDLDWAEFQKEFIAELSIPPEPPATMPGVGSA